MLAVGAGGGAFFSVPLSYLNFLPVSRGWLGGGCQWCDGAG